MGLDLSREFHRRRIAKSALWPLLIFVSRKLPVFFLQIIVDRGDLELPEAVGLAGLEDLLPVTVEDLVPVKLILAVGPVAFFLHSEVLSDRLGVEL